MGGDGSYQPIIVTSGDQLGVVEEEVTTEIIKTEIQTDEGSDQFIVTSENLEYEEDVNVKKVFVSKVSLSLTSIVILQLLFSFLLKTLRRTV